MCLLCASPPSSILSEATSTVAKLIGKPEAVASFGASLMDYNIMTMSVAPRDIHDAQVQFALERGLPAMIGNNNAYKGWQRPAKDLEKEQMSFEDLAKRLCWKKIVEKDSLIAVWRKPSNHMHCRKNSKTRESPKFCTVPDPDFGWCDITDILLEMYQILCPEGVVIIRVHVDMIVKVKGVTDRMRWNKKILHSEKGAFDTEKILLVDNSEL